MATNNVAEYRGLIAGLEEAAEVGATDVEVPMDSKLVVEQMSGRWKVKHPDLIALHRAGDGGGGAGSTSINYAWIPRAKNSHADRLANEAMDAAAELRDACSTPRSAKAADLAAGLDRRPRRRRPGFCCCGTGRPSCPCSGGIPAAATRR